jgi:hypothetical protein
MPAPPPFPPRPRHQPSHVRLISFSFILQPFVDATSHCHPLLSVSRPHNCTCRKPFSLKRPGNRVSRATKAARDIEVTRKSTSVGETCRKRHPPLAQLFTWSPPALRWPDLRALIQEDRPPAGQPLTCSQPATRTHPKILDSPARHNPLPARRRAFPGAGLPWPRLSALWDK